MKLMMHSFDFGECLLTFRVPQDVMWNNHFGNVPDGVEVDMAAITDNAALGIKELAATDSQQLKGEILRLIMDDAYACSWQTLGQYRSGLFKEIAKLSPV